MTDINAIVRNKMASVAAKQGMTPAAHADFLLNYASYGLDEMGKVRHLASGKSVKAVVKNMIETRPECFSAAALAKANVDTFNPATASEKKSSNPWRLPPGPENDAKRAKVIRTRGAAFAAGLAKSAGVDLAARPLRTNT